MTDNEIIKEFELFIKYSASEKALNDALDLINRQKAEIDKLKIEICALSEKRITFPERLKIVKHARTEAIKEFAERLKEKYIYVTPNEIDNLVKEMTESEDEENGK